MTISFQKVLLATAGAALSLLVLAPMACSASFNFSYGLPGDMLEGMFSFGGTAPLKDLPDGVYELEDWMFPFATDGAGSIEIVDGQFGEGSFSFNIGGGPHHVTLNPGDGIAITAALSTSQTDPLTVEEKFVSTPEPASSFAILALGTVGAGIRLKRKR